MGADEHPPAWYCPAWIKRRSQQCQQRAGSGTDHPGFGFCKIHTGNTLVGRQDGARRMAMALGGPGASDPWKAISQEISRAAGHVNWLTTKVGEFDIPEHAVLTEDGVGTVGFLTAEQQQWYTLYLEERKRLVDVSVLAIRAGFKEREVRLAEKQGELLVLAIETALARLGLTKDQMDMLPDILPGVLRSMSGEILAIENGDDDDEDG